MIPPVLQRLETLPRMDLVTAPTPVHLAPRLSEALGVEIWFKRDDLTGRGLGGNKIRTLEYLLGDALDQGKDTLVTGAGPQSNWAFLAALTARVAGLEPHIVYYGSPRPASGNHRLAELLGVPLRWTGVADRTSVDPILESTAQELIEAGKAPYVVPRGGATSRGCLGYVRGAAELVGQLTEQGLEPDAIWLATGSCGTQAGLLAGLSVLGAGTGVVGVATSRTGEESRRRVHELATGALDLLGSDAHLPEPTVLDGFIGQGYGIATPEGDRATALVARTEGVLLDPVFGAKAMAALMHRADQGALRGPVVYLVTGGGPTLLSSGGGQS